MDFDSVCPKAYDEASVSFGILSLSEGESEF